MPNSKVIPLTTEEKTTFLQSVPAFQTISPTDLTSIAEMLQYQYCDPDYTFFHEGDTGSSLFILKLGQAAVIKNTTQVATLTTRDIFGEMGILSSTPRSATITALTPCYYFVLPGFSLSELTQKNPTIQKFFQNLIASRNQ